MKRIIDMNSIMPIGKSHSNRRDFPLRLYVAAFMISLLTTVFSGWQTWQMHYRVEALSYKRAALADDVGRIMQYDEILTMSARMAAATGDFAYEKRYDEFDPKLTREINEVRALLPQAEIAAFVTETDDANNALVKMERQAFTWTHQGRRHEASALLTSDEYLRLKKVYAGGMEKTIKAATGMVEREARSLDVRSVWFMLASVLSILVLLATWFFTVRSARNWAAERRESVDLLRKAHDELEILVDQRTAELSHANIQLKHEITERTAAHARIKRLNQLYLTLSQCNQAIVRSTSQDELLPQLCQDAVQFGGFKMAWIGLIDESSRRVVPVASYGEGVEYLKDMIISVDADDPSGRGPTGISMREDQPYWCQDFQNDPVTALWHESGRRFGWGASAALPLHCNNVVVGALTLYANESNAFDEQTCRLLVEMASDISYALSNFAREAERKQALQKLHDSENRFRNLVETTNDLIWEVDENSVYTYLSPRIHNILGYLPEELIGKTSFDLMPAEEEKRVVKLFGPLIAAQEPLNNIENINLHKLGHRVVLETNGVPIIDKNGKLCGYRGVDRDITERKRAEEFIRINQARFSAIFNQSPLGIALIDSLTGKINEVNPKFAEIAGKTVEQMASIDWVSITHPDDVQKDLDNMALLNAGKIPGFRMEKRYLRPDGSIVWISMTIAPIREGEDISPHHLCMIEDITERKQVENEIQEMLKAADRSRQIMLNMIEDQKLAEAQMVAQYGRAKKINAQLMETNQKLEQAQNQLFQSEKMAAIGLLAAGVAHEINNPIGYVNSNLGTLEKYLGHFFSIMDKYEAAEVPLGVDNPLFQELRQYKEKINLNRIRKDTQSLIAESQQGLERIKKIILDLKEFSHSDIKNQWVLADVHQGLDSTLNVVWNELKYKCEIVKEYGVLPKIYCLPSELNQVFMNLLVNAGQAIDVRGTITLRTGQQGDRIWVEVRDTGQGILPENITHLFDPFFTTKPVGQGTGLGLSVSYRIVEKHHGEIEVHSEVGKGSTFRVWLPVQQPDTKEMT
ncbi:MAG: PAS domain S-box protein [Gallionella sp.]|jgi:PAS domain S-box-containing protein